MTREKEGQNMGERDEEEGEEEWENPGITEKEPSQGLAPPLPLSLFIWWKTGSHM